MYWCKESHNSVRSTLGQEEVHNGKTNANSEINKSLKKIDIKSRAQNEKTWYRQCFPGASTQEDKLLVIFTIVNINFYYIVEKNNTVPAFNIGQL